MKKTICILLTLFMLFSFGCDKNPISDTTGAAETDGSTTTGSVPVNPTVEGEIIDLRVNYEKNPSCLDESPAFSWVMSSGLRGRYQTAYRILVSENENNLKPGAEAVYAWDSGTVKSDASVLIKCDKEFQPHTRYYWTVDVTTNDGGVIRSGETAYFETGLMAEGFNGAEWIVQESGGARNCNFSGTSWIWLSGGEAFGSTSVATQYFRFSFSINEGKKIKSALLAFSADDYGKFYINGSLVSNKVQTTDGWKSGVLMDVTDKISVGDNTLAASVTNSEVGYAGLIAKVYVEYEDGTYNSYGTGKTWRAAISAASGWENTDFDDSSWGKPDQAVKYGESPWYEYVTLTVTGNSSAKRAGAPIVRKTFTVNDGIKSAYLFATAAGLYVPYLNGTKVGESALTPGTSECDERVMYQSYNVASMLVKGENALGAMLGRGWYIGAFSSWGGQTPAFICKLVITYTDGTVQTLASDGSWSFTLDGPITANDIFNGETYDATREIDGWCTASFDDSMWQKVEVTTAKSLGIGKIVPQLSGSVRTMDTIKAVKVTKVSTNVFIYDFGQNLAGFVSVTLTGDTYNTIRLRHGEMLNDGSRGSDGAKGTLYTTNLRSAAATDYYTLKGAPEGETYEPSFTFHGFRYVEIMGISHELPLENVVAKVLYSDMEDTGILSTSSKLVNQLISNTYWGQRSNFLSTPTDCPQRDERMGWSGDAQVFAGTAAYNMNVKAFFDKYITDMNDCQRANGAYPDVAPGTDRGGYSGSGNSAWGDAGIIIPWIMYTRYGDVSYIQKYYSNMSKYIRYLITVSPKYIKSNSAYGDWLSVGESTDKAVTDTAYCVYVCDLMVKMANLLGKADDAAKFADYAQKYRDAWCAKYLTESGRLKSHTQTSYVVALRFNIIPEASRAKTAGYLNQTIERNGYKLTTGFIGVSYLLPVLCDYGYIDTAFRLLQQEEYPSWLYPVLQGATTIWERWNSYTLDSGFGDAGMNSFNHYSYGSVTEWMYSYMAGITCDENAPGFKHFFLKPMAGGTITSISCEYNSIYGTIKSAWTADSGVIKTYNCTVPANTTATLYLSADDASKVLEGGKALADAEGITLVKSEGGIVVITLVSGTYSFTVN